MTGLIIIGCVVIMIYVLFVIAIWRLCVAARNSDRRTDR